MTIIIKDYCALEINMMCLCIIGGEFGSSTASTVEKMNGFHLDHLKALACGEGVIMSQSMFRPLGRI